MRGASRQHVQGRWSLGCGTTRPPLTASSPNRLVSLEAQDNGNRGTCRPQEPALFLAVRLLPPLPSENGLSSQELIPGDAASGEALLDGDDLPGVQWPASSPLSEGCPYPD
jgi:hypothetical protein